MFNRKGIRHKDFDYNNIGYYFITFRIENNDYLLSKVFENNVELTEYGRVVKYYIEDLNNELVKVDSYIIMPNHVHLILFIHEDVGEIHEFPLQNKGHSSSRRNMIIPKIIGRLKMQSSKKINIIRNSINSKFWQRNYYDRIIRNEKELDEIRKYIYYNPLNWSNDAYFI